MPIFPENPGKAIREKLDSLTPTDREVTSFDGHSREICAVFAALADEESRDCFLRVLKARMTLNAAYISLAPYEQYAHPLVRACPGDVVIDGGLKEGCSAQAHALRVGPAGRVYAFDAEPTITAVSRHNLQAFPNIRVEGLGLWHEEAVLHITYAGIAGGASRVEPAPGINSRECRCVSLDAYLAAKGEHCDLISLDVEGSEPEVLKGGMATIRRCRPKLQISIYHREEHLWEIPLMLLREKLGYTFYMASHS
jgi:FkbM family methyltransferase